jgi:hypothetical protein
MKKKEKKNEQEDQKQECQINCLWSDKKSALWCTRIPKLLLKQRCGLFSEQNRRLCKQKTQQHSCITNLQAVKNIIPLHISILYSQAPNSGMKF